MTNLRASKSPEKIGLTGAPEHGNAILECARLLHERGNLISGLTVVNHLRRISDSRAGARNVRSNYAIMQILGDIEAQGYVRIRWSEDVGSKPCTVQLTPKGYAAIAGHKCHADMCCPPTLLIEEEAEPSLTHGATELYFLTILHEGGNELDPRGLRRVFDYLGILGQVRSRVVASLESLDLVEAKRTPVEFRPTLLSIRLLARGLGQLRGHQCGANCTQPQV